MDRSKKMYPVSFMFDRDRDLKLESVSAATRISKSELLRISLDEFLRALGGDPESPNMSALQKMLKRTGTRLQPTPLSTIQQAKSSLRWLERLPASTHLYVSSMRRLEVTT